MNKTSKINTGAEIERQKEIFMLQQARKGGDNE
jgi:hypothetical protein